MKTAKMKQQTTNKNYIELIEKKSNASCPKNVLYIGVTHGDEPEGEILINRLIHETKEISAKNNLFFIPCLNPDGRDMKIRGNANFVDLNRNFPTKNWELTPKNLYFSGDYAGSEVETQFLVSVIEYAAPDLIISIHAPFGIINYDGAAEKAAEKFATFNKYPVRKDIGYPTPGSFGTYTGVERSIPVITLELPENECIEKSWNDNKTALLHFCNSID